MPWPLDGVFARQVPPPALMSTATGESTPGLLFFNHAAVCMYVQKVLGQLPTWSHKESEVWGPSGGGERLAGAAHRYMASWHLATRHPRRLGRTTCLPAYLGTYLRREGGVRSKGAGPDYLLYPVVGKAREARGETTDPVLTGITDVFSSSCVCILTER